MRCSLGDLNFALPASRSPAESTPTQWTGPMALGRLPHLRQFSVRDMGLLHHYTTSTSLALSRDRDFQKFWQVVAVQLALSDTFLLHGILSISALHLAQILPGDTSGCLADAIKHHDIALTTYQQALQELNPKRYDAIFVSACLLFIYVFAYTAGDPLEINSAHPDTTELFLTFRWVRVARGIRAVRLHGLEWLAEGPLKDVFGEELLYLVALDGDPPFPGEDDLRNLDKIWQSDKTIGQERMLLYAEVLESLIRAYRRASQRDKCETSRRPGAGIREFVQTFRWLADIPDSFVQLLEEHDPPALILMCYYAKLMDNISLSFWWTHRNSQTCLSRVRRVLDVKWHKWLTLDAAF